MPSPRVWSREDFKAVASLIFGSGSYIGTTPNAAVAKVAAVLEATEAALIAAGVQEEVRLPPASSTPRVWGRDDFLEAVRLVDGEHGNAYKVAATAAKILEKAEIFARRPGSANLPLLARDERGRFLPRPRLETADSPVVIQARAG